MSKRGNNEGSISREKGRWVARISTPHGRKRLGTYPTKQQAQQAITRELSAIRQGTYVDPAKGRIPLADYYTFWIETNERIQSPITKTKYQSVYKNHIGPQLGHLALNKVEPLTIRLWYTDRLNHAGTQAGKAYRQLRAMFNRAVADQLITANPCIIKGAGKAERSAGVALTPPQVQALAEAMPARFYALIMITALCALRFGEAAGLQRRHVDLESGLLMVEQQYQEVGAYQGFKAPKYGSSRVIALPSFACSILATHMAQFTGPLDSDLVFTGVKGGPLTQQVLYTPWRAARQAIGLAGIRFHDLRHTGATWAGKQSMPLVDLQAFLGHSTVAAALRYQHASIDAQRAASERVGRMFEPSAPEPQGQQTPSKQLLRVVS